MKDMEEILGYMEMLDELDTKNVEPMYTPIEDSVLLRKGEPRVFEGVDHIRKNFPREEKGHIKVPGIHK